MPITDKVVDLHVSIHAPVGGATLFMPILIKPLVVSIHAPVGGATRL